MKEYYIDKFIFFVMGVLIVFALFLQVSTINNTEKLKNNEIRKSEQYAANIGRLIQLRIQGEIEETLTQNPALREHLNESLQTFLTEQYRYIFVLHKNHEGRYHFLLDGSKDDPEEYKTIFFPKSALFDTVFRTKKMQIIEQNEGVEEVWLSLVYPIVRSNKTEALLVLDLSESYGEYLNNFNTPLMKVVSMMQAVLFFSFLLLISLAYRYYRLRKKLLVDNLTASYTKVFLEEFFHRNNVEDYNAILIDMDEFAKINNKYGYAAGNRIIKEFVKTMAAVLSKHTKVIRTGGTEFFVIVPKNESEFELLVQKLFDTLQEKKYLHKNEVLHLTVSMSAVVIPQGKNSIHDIQRFLDEKLLEVKSRGKNGLEIIGSDKIHNIQYGNLDYIKQALDEERLVCLYQPIFETESKKIIKYEALVRLIDKEQNEKLIIPSHFMSVLKGTSQYIKMSKLVLKEVFTTLEKHPDIEISMNIDLDDLYNADMMKLINKKLYSHKNLANRVTFEILEHHEIKDYAQVALIFQQLKAYGSKIAIDDFGSGFANYIYLIKLDVDILKVDGSIIKELRSCPERTKKMLDSINNLANKYDIEVVAEHVSTQEIFETLRDLKIEFSQGYYLGEPKLMSEYLDAKTI